MNALANGLQDILRACSLIRSIRVVSYDETPVGRWELKIRCRVVQGYQFQIWLHFEPAFQDYAYQLFVDHPVLRWDNAPHYPQVPSAPHHFHDERGNVSASPLSGDILRDLQEVLFQIEVWLSRTAGSVVP